MNTAAWQLLGIAIAAALLIFAVIASHTLIAVTAAIALILDLGYLAKTRLVP